MSAVAGRALTLQTSTDLKRWFEVITGIAELNLYFDMPIDRNEPQRFFRAVLAAPP